MEMAEKTILKDADIRFHFQKWLEAQHPEPDTRILHEMKVKEPPARIDMALINGSMSGYEIKSDVDSFARLARQARAFSSVFDNLCLVVTDRFAPVAAGALPEWWGIIHCQHVRGQLKFNYLRRPAKNPLAVTTARIAALSRSECLEILERCNVANGVRAATKSVVRQALFGRLDQEVLDAEIREVLKKRADRIKAFHAQTASLA